MENKLIYKEMSVHCCIRLWHSYSEKNLHKGCLIHFIYQLLYIIFTIHSFGDQCYAEACPKQMAKKIA